MPSKINFFICFMLFYAFIVTSAEADEPPSFAPFQVTSQNDRYRAEIEPDDKEQWQRNRYGVFWNLTVYDTWPDPEDVMWKSRYEHTGYSGGLLSNDGNSFVYLEFWYSKDTPLIYFYHKGRLVTKVMSGEIGFNRGGMTQTASNHLWLSNEHPPEINVDGELVITTIDNTRHTYQMSSGRNLSTIRSR